MSRLPGRSVIGGAFLLLVSIASAQQPAALASQAAPASPGGVRAQLQRQLALYQAAAESPAYSVGLRDRARTLATQVQARLREGDFRPGDRILVRVEQQPQLSDTSGFAVVSGPALVLPGVGGVGLSGVLVDELEPTVRTAVWRVYRDAVVRAERLVRIAVEGGVGRPGFYSVRGESRLDDVIQAAGGTGPTSVISRMSVERGSVRVVTGDSLQLALRDARTVNDLGIVDGDRLVVPVEAPHDPERNLRLVGYLLTIPVTLIGLVQIIRGTQSNP